MNGKQTYSVEFREQALAKVLQRGNRSVGTVASEQNMNVLTLRKWIRVSNAANRNPGPVDARRPEDGAVTLTGRRRKNCWGRVFAQTADGFWASSVKRCHASK
ncbi:transposase, partial [Paraburkholderia nemoris]